MPKFESTMRATANALLILTLCLGASAHADWNEPADNFDLVPNKEVPVRLENNGNTMFWFDNTRLIMSVRKLGDWVAGPTDLSRIILLDTDTGAVTDTPYRGELVCFAPERMVVWVYPKSAGYYNVPTAARADALPPESWVSGNYGEELAPLEVKKRWSDAVPPVCADILRKDPAMPGAIHPIAEGYVVYDHRGARFYDREKRLRVEHKQNFISYQIQYIRSRGLYFNMAHRQPETTHPTLFDGYGVIHESYPYPEVLWRWVDERSITAKNAWTAAGLIWSVNAGSRGGVEGRNGVYL